MAPVHVLHTGPGLTGKITKRYASCPLCDWRSKPKRQGHQAAQRELDAHLAKEHGAAE